MSTHLLVLHHAILNYYLKEILVIFNSIHTNFRRLSFQTIDMEEDGIIEAIYELDEKSGSSRSDIMKYIKLKKLPGYKKMTDTSMNNTLASMLKGDKLIAVDGSYKLSPETKKIKELMKAEEKEEKEAVKAKKEEAKAEEKEVKEAAKEKEKEAAETTKEKLIEAEEKTTPGSLKPATAVKTAEKEEATSLFVEDGIEQVGETR